MKVIAIFLNLGPYHVARLSAAARWLNSRGASLYAVEVYSHDDTYGWNRPDDDVPFEWITLLSSRERDRTKAARAVRDVLQTFQPDVVAIPGWGEQFARRALGWCRANRRPAILLSESTARDRARPVWKEQYKKHIVRQFHAALVGGSPQRDYVIALGFPANRVFTGYNVVDNDLFVRARQTSRENAEALRADLSLPECYFLTVSRCVAVKNLPLLIDAYARYCRESPSSSPWRLVICGDGPDRVNLTSRARRAGVPPVDWRGFVQINQLPSYYALASGFILASYSEPWGLVVNEAMAAGLPLILSNAIGCAQDLARQGTNALLFEATSVDALTTRMHELSDMPLSARASMGRASSKIIQDWGPDRFACGLGQALESITGSIAPQT